MPDRKQRLLGLATVGAGGAIVATGLVLGVIAKSTYDGGVRGCDPVTHGCGASALSQIADARGQALASTVVTVVGAAAIAAGVVIYLTARSHERELAAVPLGAGLTFAGTW
jgi:hypothetical protein